MHLVDLLTVGDGVHSLSNSSGMYMKNTPPLSSNNMGNQGDLLQASGAQLIGRSAASPSSATSAISLDNTTASPVPYANSPRSGTNMMNTPSPQQQQQQQQRQQRQKLMQLPQHQQQLLARQQSRQFQMQGLGQRLVSFVELLYSFPESDATAPRFARPGATEVSAIGHEQAILLMLYQLNGQHQMQFSQPMGHQQFQGRQLAPGHVQHGIGQSQLGQGNQLNHLTQFSGAANNALFNAAKGTQIP